MKNMQYYLTPACSEEVSETPIYPHWKVSNINVWVFKKCMRAFFECVQTDLHVWVWISECLIQNWDGVCLGRRYFPYSQLSIVGKHKDGVLMILDVRNGNSFPTKPSKQTLQNQRNSYDEA